MPRIDRSTVDAVDDFLKSGSEKRKMPRVLLVDDELTFGKIVLKVAEKESIPVHFISSVKELQSLAKLEFDIAILDYDLGNVTGVQLARFIEKYFSDIPIVLTSDSPDLRDKNWPKSVIGFVSKSQGPNHLLMNVLKLYDKATR